MIYSIRRLFLFFLRCLFRSSQKSPPEKGVTVVCDRNKKNSHDPKASVQYIRFGVSIRDGAVTTEEPQNPGQTDRWWCPPTGNKYVNAATIRSSLFVTLHFFIYIYARPEKQKDRRQNIGLTLRASLTPLDKRVTISSFHLLNHCQSITRNKKTSMLAAQNGSSRSSHKWSNVHAREMHTHVTKCRLARVWSSSSRFPWFYTNEEPLGFVYVAILTRIWFSLERRTSKRPTMIIATTNACILYSHFKYFDEKCPYSCAPPPAYSNNTRVRFVLQIVHILRSTNDVVNTSYINPRSLADCPPAIGSPTLSDYSLLLRRFRQKYKHSSLFPVCTRPHGVAPTQSCMIYGAAMKKVPANTRNTYLIQQK